MTRSEFFEMAGYFANPARNTRIELEAKQNTINSYNAAYIAKTGESIPVRSDSVYILSNNADKWGREMRLYFTVTHYRNIPRLITQFMTVGGRPGYDIWNQRLNSIEIIDQLLDVGFRLGHPQDINLIRGSIPVAHINDFDNGFNIP